MTGQLFDLLPPAVRPDGLLDDLPRVGRVVDLELGNGDHEQVRAELERMCKQLLANPLIESYEIELVEDT